MNPEIRQRIEEDIAREARGREATDYMIPGRIAAVMERERQFHGNAPIRPIKRPEGAGIGPDSEGESSDGFDYYHAAQGDYEAVCQNQTGQETPQEVWESLRERRADQDAMTEEMARALDSTGRFPAKRFHFGENDPGRCTVIDLMTGAILPLSPTRRVTFLPTHAAGQRAKMLRDIEHFISTLPGSGRKAAMFTITNGPRVALHRITLREETQKFHRWLSKMAATHAFKRWGLRMEWRATEFGSPRWEHDPASGMDQMTLHLHAHCLVTLPERMTERRRKKMRKKLWKIFGVFWDDSGDIRNPREFVKYPVKDGDLETILRDGGPGLLADLRDALAGLHIVQPMGELKAVRKKRRDIARRITAFTRDNGRSLEETGDWNAVKRPLAGPNRQRAAYKRAAQSLSARLACANHCRKLGTAAGDSAGDFSESPEESGRLEGESAEPDPERRSDSGRKAPRIANRILALLAPGPYGSRYSAPAVVVWGFNGDVAAVLGQPRARAVIENHRAAYIRAGAGASRVSRESSQGSFNCPRPDSRAERPRRPEPAWATEMLLEFAKN